MMGFRALDLEKDTEDYDSKDAVSDDEDVTENVTLDNCQEDYYDFDFWPKTGTIDTMEGFTFKSRDY